MIAYRRSSAAPQTTIQSSSGLSTKLRLTVEGGIHQMSQEAEYGTFDAADHDEMTALLGGGPSVNRRRSVLCLYISCKAFVRRLLI